MPKTPDSAEIIPFDQVRRIVAERRRRRPAAGTANSGETTPMTTAHTSQVRLILSRQRADRSPTDSDQSA